MKKLYFLNEEEKQRILNMHKDATKRNYLTENYNNKQLLLEYSLANVREGLANFFKKLTLIIRRGIPKSLGNITAAKKSLIASLQNKKILDDSGQLYRVFKEEGTDKWIIRKYDFEEFLDDNLKDWVTSKEFKNKDVEGLIAQELKDNRFFITTDMFEKIYKIEKSGGDYEITVAKDLSGNYITPPSIGGVGADPINFKYAEFMVAKRASNLSKQIRSTRSARNASLILGTVGLVVTGLWQYPFKWAGDFYYWVTGNNSEVAADISKLKGPVEDFITNTCTIIDKYQSNTTYGGFDFDHEIQEIDNMITNKQYVKLKTKFERYDLDFLYQIMYVFKDTQSKCLLTHIFDKLEKNYQLFENNVRKPIQATADKVKQEKTAVLNSNEFFKSLPNMVDQKGKLVSSYQNFNIEIYKKRFLENCPCKLFEYIQGYQGNPVQFLALGGKKPNKNETIKFTEIAIVDSDEKNIISSFCNEMDYKSFKKAKKAYDDASTAAEGINTNKLVLDQEEQKKIDDLKTTKENYKNFIKLIESQNKVDCKTK